MIELVRWLIFLALVWAAAPRTFTWFVPVVGNDKPGKGIGLAYSIPGDAAAVGAAWYYDWTSSGYADAHYVPMSWGGEDPGLAQDYAGYLLILNEPEGQGNKTPEQAIAIYGELRQWYPKAKIIFGGCGLWGTVWISRFQELLHRSELARPDGWHFHGYVEGSITVEDVIGFWTWAEGAVVRPGEELWVTEYMDVYGNQENLRRMHDWIAEHASRGGAAFANRVAGDESWYPATWPQPPVLSLVGRDGRLTELGEWYRRLR